MNIYEELGLTTYINGAATLTMWGGSIMPSEVLDAMKEASKYFVNIPQLQRAVGDRIAQWTGNEAAFISDGAAAGMALAAAAIIAGDDAERRMRLPDSTGWKNEVLVSNAFRVGYEHAIRIGGGKLVGYGGKDRSTAEELEAAINENTAAIFVFYNDNFMDKMAPLEEQIAIAKKHNIPLVVDAAAQIPPISNLWRFTQMGADLAIFSGGKGLRGPQASGLMVGTRKLIDVVATYACPNGGIGRPLKVGKEEIIGLMTAIRIQLDTDQDALMKDYEDQVAAVIDAFKDDDAVTVTRSFPSEAGQPNPRAFLQVNEGKLKLDCEGIGEALKAGEPHIFVSAGKNGMHINPQTLQPGEMAIIIDALKKIIDANRV